MRNLRERRMMSTTALAATFIVALTFWQGVRCGGALVSTAGDASFEDARAPRAGNDTGVGQADTEALRAGDGSWGAALQADYDPTEQAASSRNQIFNREAGIPPQCYTKTDGSSNPCWTCHSESRYPNLMSDWHLQKEYAFSEEGLTNHWTNLFEDRRAAAATVTDVDILTYVRQDNYVPLVDALARRPAYTGYRPDLDFSRGFDAKGFALDGSGWRAFRYKPFPGVFWPTNGASDDVMIRLPRAFRQRAGADDMEVYKANLAIVEASFASPPDAADAEVTWPTEPIDERAVRRDLDGDRKLRVAKRLRGLPPTYVGDAAGFAVERSLYPQGTEFLHSVRYLDPEASNLMSRRMKELRYARKDFTVERWKIISNYEREMNEREEGKPPVVQGDPLTGMLNGFGWRLQGFIEDASGRLRVQTHEEHLHCMGCHTNLGVTLDQTFSFPRKVPGQAGWGHQDLRGIPDVPQWGHAEGEILTYLRRVKAADEFRANDEMIARFFPAGRLAEGELRRASPGGDLSIADLLAPSRGRALALNKAYRTLIETQAFARGRDTVLQPTANVHRTIENGSTELGERGKIYTDGQLRLQWRGAGFGI